MAQAAQLPADDLVAASLDRLEPHRDDLPGDGVLRDPHIRQAKIVDHILGGEIDDDVAIDRDMQLSANDRAG